jgi:diguanylate cyclase (GGDEF)-like protein
VMYKKRKTNKILIVDDSEMNRAILSDMLNKNYEILEAEDGVAAVQLLHTYGTEITLVLLDIVMPKMDGFEVLAMMSRYHWIEEIPVIMISAENSHSVIERAYELGATDYISRPFDEVIVCRRVINTMMLYSKQKRLVSMVADQMYESEKSNTLMVSILSHIVEFRNGESGLHVLHIGTMTEMLLKRLREKTDRYHLDGAAISMISKAAAFHDIGKISISEEILNKPGRLTKEEFEIMKTHSMVGAEMLKNLPIHKEEPLVKVAYEICRWHHERYDGKGYPDGLKGEEIPISAQVVSLADAYDALISERVYKKAFSHEKAMSMILNGECGAFHPLLLECLSDISDNIEEELAIHSLNGISEKEIHNIVERLLSHKELAASNRTLSMLEEERMKFHFFASMASEIQFEYTVVPNMITISDWGAEKLGISRLIVNPAESSELLAIISKENLQKLDQKLRLTTPEYPIVEYEAELKIDGTLRFSRIICRALWTQRDKKEYGGAIGKIVDLQEEQQELKRLKKLASLDSLTNLLNGEYTKKEIMRRLRSDQEKEYALIIFDLDYFKAVNHERGHLFGDRVLKYLADRLSRNIGKEDLAARIGGDEFLLFMGCNAKLKNAVKRLFTVMTGEYDGFQLSISMGIAKTASIGRNYEELYRCADQALFEAKRKGRGCYVFYDEKICSGNVPTAISPIDPIEEE